MFEFDAFHLARLQFAFTVSFHILFPAITIGLASYLVVLEGMWLRTRDNVWRSLYNFWLKIFAVNFGMGVVSGLVMSYQFGTNWSGFSQFAGSITGPLLLYEVLTAFFLEAGFLGVMLFGWNKVPPALHFFTTCMVALGTLVSTFWILASNSWMQTPQGFIIENGHLIPQDWLAIIFNPSFPYRLFHMAIAAFLSSAMFVGASAAWHLLRGNDSPAIRKMLSMAMWMALLVAPIQAVVGDMHGLNTLEHQPAKIAAFLMTREAAHQLSFEKALQSIRNNYPPGKLPPISEYANTYYNMSEGGEVRGSWNSDKHFDYVKDPQPGVDGGDGSASVGLTPEQEALCKAMLKRTQSDPQGDPLTGAELGAGKQNTSSSAK